MSAVGLRVACDGTLGLQRTAWRDAGRGTHRLRDLARNCRPCRPPVLRNSAVSPTSELPKGRTARVHTAVDVSRDRDWGVQSQLGEGGFKSRVRTRDPRRACGSLCRSASDTPAESSARRHCRRRCRRCRPGPPRSCCSRWSGPVTLQRQPWRRASRHRVLASGSRGQQGSKAASNTQRSPIRDSAQ